MWSNVVLFWFLFGVILTFWMWFLDFTVNWRLLLPSDSATLPNLLTASMVASFIWSYLALYVALAAQNLATPHLALYIPKPSSIVLGPLDLLSFPFLLIFLLVTVISLLFCLSYNRRELTAFSVYIGIIFFAGFLFFSTTSIVTFFLAYELFLIPSFLILYKFAKTRRAIEAAYLMFFWTQFGALFLMFSFLFIFFSLSSTSWDLVRNYNFSPNEGCFLLMCWFIGFGVKLPLWPFYGWLPKAHVEASTNFSIFLSGVLVKFAFFGLLRCLYTLNLDVACPFMVPFLTIGIVDASLKLLIQVDLKKLVAYATVIEMHWLTICIISGSSPIILAGWAMLINHALLSASAFLLVDAINRRFKTRLITEISGLNLLCPKLFILSFINCLLFLGFPGSLTFVSEVLFFSFLCDLFPILAIILVFFLYLVAPSFFFRSWFNAMFGASRSLSTSVAVDLSTREFLAIGSLEVLIYYLGLTWQTLPI